MAQRLYLPIGRPEAAGHAKAIFAPLSMRRPNLYFWHLADIELVPLNVCILSMRSSPGSWRPQRAYRARRIIVVAPHTVTGPGVASIKYDKLVFLGSALERLGDALNAIKKPVVSFDGELTHNLVFAADAPRLRAALVVDVRADWELVHHEPLWVLRWF